MNSFRTPHWILPLAIGVAVAACAKPKERKPVDEHLNRAFELVENDPQKALAEIEQAPSATDSQRAYIQGLSLEDQKKLPEAEEALLKAVKADPDGLKPRTALARVQLLQRKTTEAREHLQKVVAKDPGSLPAILLLTVAHDGRALKEEARRALENWPQTRAEGAAQVPLRAEYFIALASVTDAPSEKRHLVESSRSAEVGSIPAALTLAKFAVLGDKPQLAGSLLARLAGADADTAQLQSIATVALSLRATRTAGHALTRIPGSVRTPEVLALRGRHQLLDRHPKRALPHFMGALERADSGNRALVDELEYYVAATHHADGNAHAAVNLLKKILKRSPNHRAAQFLLSEIELLGGQVAEAIARLESLEGDYPEDAGVLVRLGDALMGAKQHEQAELRFKKAFGLAPDDLRLPHRIVQAMRKRAQEGDALTLIRQVRKTYPQSVSLLRSEVTQLVRMNEPDEAISAVQKAGKTMENRVGVQLLLADTYDTLGRDQEVTRVLEELVKAESQSARAWSALARLQGRSKDFAKMEKSLRQVVQLEPAALKDKARLATVLNNNGKAKEAAKLFGELAEASHSDLVALNNAAMLYAGELNDPGRAVEYAERAYELASSNPAIMDTLAWALLKKGRKLDLERALTLLRRASSRSDSAEIAFHLGVALRRSERDAEGISMIKKALAEAGDASWRAEAELALK